MCTHTHTQNKHYSRHNWRSGPTLTPFQRKENITVIVSHFYWYCTSVLGLGISSDKPFYFEFSNVEIPEKKTLQQHHQWWWCYTPADNTMKLDSWLQWKLWFSSLIFICTCVNSCSLTHMTQVSSSEEAIFTFHLDYLLWMGSKPDSV